jgi:hypothetical protein
VTPVIHADEARAITLVSTSMLLVLIRQLLVMLADDWSALYCLLALT